MAVVLTNTCAVLTMLVLSIYFYRRYRLLTLSYKVLEAAMFLILIAGLFGISSHLISPISPLTSRALLLIGQSGCIMLGWFFQMYIRCLHDSKYRVLSRGLVHLLPFVLLCSAAFASLYIPLPEVFGFSVTQVLVFVGGAYSFASALLYTFRYRNRIPREHSLALLFAMAICFVFVLIGVLCQIPLVCPAESAAIMLLTLTVFNMDEEKLFETGVVGSSLFFSRVESLYKRKRSFTVLAMIWENYYTLQNESGVEQVEKLTKSIYGALKSLNCDIIGRLGNRTFCILETDEFKSSKEQFGKIVSEFGSAQTVSGQRIGLKTKWLRIACPKDAASTSEINELIAIAKAREIDESSASRIADLSSSELINHLGEKKTVLGSASEQKDRGYVWLFNDDDMAAFVRERTINSLLDVAVEQGLLRVMFQPLYSVAAGKFTSAEALVGMRTESLGNVSPGEFIPLAEKSRAVEAIDQFVLETVCKFISENKLSDYGVEFIHVNLSGIECLKDNFASRILRTLEKYHVSTKEIVFEITETAMNELPPGVLDQFRQMSEYGISFSLDDYGVGYSNIERLVQLPLESIKFDRSLIYGALYGSGDKQGDKSHRLDPNVTMNSTRIALENTFIMVKQMGKHIIAEGIETQREAEYCIEKGADYLQGYYYAKPLSADAFLKYLR